MKIDTRKIDHLVYGVPDLDQAIHHFNAVYGIAPIRGGKHKHKGTHNAIINLGNECYLELLAIDKENTIITGNRWMGMDFVENAKITRWAIKSKDVSSDVEVIKKVNPALGTLGNGLRITESGNTLSWEMSMPLANPEVELIPFLINWSESGHHPTHNLDVQCELIEMTLTHPEPPHILDCFHDLGIALPINRATETSFKATFSGPKGIFTL